MGTGTYGDTYRDTYRDTYGDTYGDTGICTRVVHGDKDLWGH